jgi:hypothetical protein
VVAVVEVVIALMATLSLTSCFLWIPEARMKGLKGLEQMKQNRRGMSNTSMSQLFQQACEKNCLHGAAQASVKFWMLLAKSQCLR